MGRVLTFCVLLGVVVCSGCGLSVWPLPGTNRAPLILTADIGETADGKLFIRASIHDPNQDDLEIVLEQINGPFALRRMDRRIGGLLQAEFEPTEAGFYAFELTVGDGEFETAIELGMRVGNDDSVDDVDRDGLAVRLPPTGVFPIRLSGQVLADEGLAPFALDGELVILADGLDGVAVELRTFSVPRGTLASPGSVTLSTQDVDGVLLDVFLFDNELVLVGPVALRRSPGRFKTAEFRAGGFDVVSAVVRVEFAGDGVRGTVALSSNEVPIDLLPDVAAYFAQFVSR